MQSIMRKNIATISVIFIIVLSSRLRACIN